MSRFLGVGRGRGPGSGGDPHRLPLSEMRVDPRRSEGSARQRERSRSPDSLRVPVSEAGLGAAADEPSLSARAPTVALRRYQQEQARGVERPPALLRIASRLLLETGDSVIDDALSRRGRVPEVVIDQLKLMHRQYLALIV